MAGTTVGDHLNTRVFLVAFQLCIRNGCNQVGNNSVDKADIAMVRKISYASVFRNSNTEFNFAHNSESSLFKSSFLFLFL